jgi:hypothetical protein
MAFSSVPFEADTTVGAGAKSAQPWKLCAPPAAQAGQYVMDHKIHPVSRFGRRYSSLARYFPSDLRLIHHGPNVSAGM